MPNTHKYRQAFHELPNLIGLAIILVLSLALRNPLPALVGLALEAGYLLFVPESGWYGRLLRLRDGVALQKRRLSMRTDVLPTLTPDLRARYQRLETLCEQVDAQTANDRPWFTEAPHKFDYLLDKFLVFASKQTQFTLYLMSVHDEICGGSLLPPVNRHDAFAAPLSPNAAALGQYGHTATPPPGTQSLNPTDPRMQQLVHEILEQYALEQQQVTDLLGNEQDDNTTAVLHKRLEILKRRAEFLTKISKIMVNLGHQLHLLEDTFGLVSDEIRARSPEQVLADIDEVISQTDTMTKVLEELAPYEHMVNRIGPSAQQSM